MDLVPVNMVIPSAQVRTMAGATEANAHSQDCCPGFQRQIKAQAAIPHFCTAYHTLLLHETSQFAVTHPIRE